MQMDRPIESRGSAIKQEADRLPINLQMDFGEKSRVMEVLNKAFAGSVVDKRVAAAAIREFQGILDELYKQPPRWELVTMRRSEVDNMREVIRYQDEKIRSITDKVNSLGLNGGDASPKFSLQTDKERQDTERRMSLASRFNAVYEVEWKASFSELATTMNWSDLECIYTLMRVIRNACDLCVQLAEDQMDKMLLSMEDSVLDPLNGTGGRLKQLFEQQNSEVYSDGMKVAEKYALEYRKERAEASVPAVIELFMETKIRAIIEPQYMRREFKKYLLKVIELVWLMTTLDPPVRLYWQSQTERINADFFEFYFRKGDFVNQTVWPAVFMHNTGRLLHKGQVLAM